MVTQEFIDVHSLDVGPLSDLSDGTLGINGFRVFSWPLGYTIIMVQVEGVWSYDKDQVALVILDSTGFWSKVPVTLGTSTINQIINVIKESEINELLVSFSGLRMAQLLVCWQAEPLIKKEATMHQTVNLNDLEKVDKLRKKEEIDAFSSKIMHS